MSARPARLTPAEGDAAYAAARCVVQTHERLVNVVKCGMTLAHIDAEVARLLREQEVIFTTASVGIVFLRDRRIVRCNARFEQMYGYAPGELNGRSTRELYLSDEDFERVEASYAQMRAGGYAEDTLPRRRKDGLRGFFWPRTTYADDAEVQSAVTAIQGALPEP